jgi:hypothetical protein
MASTATPPPRTRRWRRAEYKRLVALDVFPPGEHLELSMFIGCSIVGAWIPPEPLSIPTRGRGETESGKA